MHIPGWQLGLSVMDTPGPTWLYMITQESGLTRAKVSLMPFSALLESLTRVFNVACLISHFCCAGLHDRLMHPRTNLSFLWARRVVSVKVWISKTIAKLI